MEPGLFHRSIYGEDAMDNRFILTAFGKERPGIVAEVESDRLAVANELHVDIALSR